MLPSITLAIPYYSNLGYLRRAIESVVRQRDDSWKLIVCDDGEQSEETEHVVLGFRDARMAYHRNPRRLGMAANWNRCLDLAESDLVTLLHADDELLPNYTATMRETAYRHPRACALFCETDVIGENGRRLASLPELVKRVLRPAKGRAIELSGREGVKALLRGNFIMCPTLCYRKALLGPRRFCDRWRMVQDLDFTTGLLLEGESLLGIPTTAYRYRRHSNNASAQYTRDLLRFREESELYAILERKAAERGWSDVARVARRKTIIKLNLGWCVLKDAVRLRLGSALTKARFLYEVTTAGGEAPGARSRCRS
ncbi:MAG TPA: glycosyltransferase family 2 protein [Pirellulales bacterium]|nr:glycosyltransferase family 2 protein [Pirellulales bacterium]